MSLPTHHYQIVVTTISSCHGGYRFTCPSARAPTQAAAMHSMWTEFLRAYVEEDGTFGGSDLEIVRRHLGDAAADAIQGHDDMEDISALLLEFPPITLHAFADFTRQFFEAREVKSSVCVYTDRSSQEVA